MDKKIINCENSLTALNSLAQVFSMAPSEVVEGMLELNCACDVEASVLEKLLQSKFCENVKNLDFKVVWFHGTRLLREHTIYSEGLLPAYMMKDRVYNQLCTLVGDIDRIGANPFGGSYASKPAKEGPFGVLFRDVALTPMGGNGCFFGGPELVEDLAGEMLGANQFELVNRFKKMTSPCVVHFIGSPTENTLKRVLRFVYETQVEGRDCIISANSCTTCFDGEGYPVLPSDICKIEYLDF